MSIFVGKSNKACRLQQHAVLAAGQRGVEILLKTTRDAQQLGVIDQGSIIDVIIVIKSIT